MYPRKPSIHGLAIVPMSDLAVPATLSGRDLLDKGLTLKNGPGVIWITYRKAP
jgi:hypothetical protein